MLKRILAVIIASILVAGGLSLFSYVPDEQREADIYYGGIAENFGWFLYFLLIFYTVAGLPISWIIDKWRNRYNADSVIKSYLVGLLFYSLAGLVVGEVLESMNTLGVIASIVYFHLLIVIGKIFSKR